MLIASWNIEKNGVSSTDIKQTMVSGFVDYCLNDLRVDILFLCEVHSSRLEDYRSYVAENYRHYCVDSFSGGYSNCYILIYKATGNIRILGDQHLVGLTRDIITVEVTSVHNNFNGFMGFAHFKSGRTNLTRNQLEDTINFFAGASNGAYFITGDLNWDYSDYPSLTLNAANAVKQWDVTQAKGGCLDWGVYGPMTQASAFDFSGVVAQNPELCAMQGPDHKPVIFEVRSL